MVHVRTYNKYLSQNNEFLQCVSGFFSWSELRGMKLTTHLHLVPRSRMCGAIRLIPLYAFAAQTGTCLPLPFTINLTQEPIHILHTSLH